jgi:integrase
VMGMHALRHSNASLRLADLQDIVYVCDQLGHATANVTLRTYAHLIPRTDRDASSLDRTVTQLGGLASG